MRVEEPPKPLRFLQKIEKPVPRPPTPAVEVPSEVSSNIFAICEFDKSSDCQWMCCWHRYGSHFCELAVKIGIGIGLHAV